jgi:adenosine kinase
MGALAATYCLENPGTQNHKYTIAEFAARYVQQFGEQPALEVLVNQESIIQ